MPMLKNSLLHHIYALSSRASSGCGGETLGWGRRAVVFLDGLWGGTLNAGSWKKSHVGSEQWEAHRRCLLIILLDLFSWGTQREAKFGIFVLLMPWAKFGIFVLLRFDSKGEKILWWKFTVVEGFCNRPISVWWKFIAMYDSYIFIRMSWSHHRQKKTIKESYGESVCHALLLTLLLKLTLHLFECGT